MLIAPTGHRGTHTPHPVHKFPSTFAVIIFLFTGPARVDSPVVPTPLPPMLTPLPPVPLPPIPWPLPPILPAPLPPPPLTPRPPHLPIPMLSSLYSHAGPPQTATRRGKCLRQPLIGHVAAAVSQSLFPAVWSSSTRLRILPRVCSRYSACPLNASSSCSLPTGGAVGAVYGRSLPHEGGQAPDPGTPVA